jgi:hypothetical protein
MANMKQMWMRKPPELNRYQVTTVYRTGDLDSIPKDAEDIMIIDTGTAQWDTDASAWGNFLRRSRFE